MCTSKDAIWYIVLRQLLRALLIEWDVCIGCAYAHTRIYAGYPMNKGDIELYDLQEDPGELRNIAEQNPERVAQLQGMIPALKQGNLEEYEALSGEINEEISEQLQALGYFE